MYRVTLAVRMVGGNLCCDALAVSWGLMREKQHTEGTHISGVKIEIFSSTDQELSQGRN